MTQPRRPLYRPSPSSASQIKKDTAHPRITRGVKCNFRQRYYAGIIQGPRKTALIPKFLWNSEDVTNLLFYDKNNVKRLIYISI